MRSILPLTALLSLLVSCGNETPPTETTVPANDSAVATVLSVDLGPQDMPLFVELGDAALLGIEEPTVRWNEERGRMEVDGGEHFGIVITEEAGDMERLRADLDRDMLRKHTIIEQSADHLVYRSQFPDEALVFLHFYRIVRAGDRTFTVQDNENGRYNEADVARMAKAVRTQPAV